MWCWGAYIPTECPYLRCGMCQGRRGRLIWCGQCNCLVLTWWQCSCSFLDIFKMYQERISQLESAVKIRFHWYDMIGDHSDSGSIPAAATWQLTSNKCLDIYFIITILVITHVLSWSVNRINKHDLFCKLITICGSVWSPVLISQVVLTLI